MPDQETLNDSSEHAGPGPIMEKSNTAWGGKTKRDFLDIAELIRSIQRVEGDPDCFRKGNDYCDEAKCAWRRYCIETHKDSSDDKVP